MKKVGQGFLIRFLSMFRGINIGLLLIAIIITAFVTYSLTTNTNQFSVDQGEQLSEEEINEVITALQDNILLPEGEEPFVAKIIDASLIKDSQPFYKDAQDGDYLVIYSESARAILYSKDRDLVINTGPVELQDQPATSEQNTAFEAQQVVEEESEPVIEDDEEAAFSNEENTDNGSLFEDQ